MPVTIDQLDDPIRKILTAPGTDLATISAKRVRLQLLQDVRGLSEEWVRENKSDIDAIIARIYQSMAQSLASDDAAAPSNQKSKGSATKRKREPVDDFDVAPSSQPMASSSKATSNSAHKANGASKASNSASATNKQKNLSSKAVDDEEYARKLNEELNGRAELRRSAAKSKGTTGSKPNKRVKKSAARVGSDEDEVTESKPRKGGFHKEYQLSEPLAILVGSSRASRPFVVKKLWEHIKADDLQNPANKREILCDSQMRAVFAVDRIDMMQMNKRLGEYLYDIEG